MKVGELFKMVFSDRGSMERTLRELVLVRDEFSKALSALLEKKPELKKEEPFFEALLCVLQPGEDLFRDPLTKVNDRRLLEAGIYDSLLLSAERHSRPISVVLADVDNLKLKNDKFGHQVGDEILKRVALAFLGKSRKADIVIRYGGDEFLLILPETDAVGARRLMARVVSSFPPDISVSFGICSKSFQNSRNETTLQAMIAEADLLVYQQKRRKAI
jgi:diguanylate cyclase (GGDEF)-like protein